MKLRKAKDIIGFSDTWLLIIGIPLIGVLISIILFGNYVTDLISDGHLPVCWLASVFYVTVFWLGYRGLFMLLHTKYPDASDTTKRVSLLIALVLVSYFILSMILHALTGPIVHGYFGLPKPNPVLEIIGALLVGFFILSLYEGFALYHRLRKTELEKEVLEKESVLTQLASLKSQVNPHFLFNSLNTLSYLIPESPERAENFVQKLSRVYRYILEIKDEKLIPLDDELNFLNSYVFLLKERFGDNLVVSINIDKKYLNRYIIPLSLQLLFENAIKHNEISKAKPLTISVYINDKGNLVVNNNLQKKNLVRQTSKLGLQNIKSRYELLTDKLVEVIEDIKNFTVVVPLLKAIN